MAVNKVVYGNSTLIDLTSDTVAADKLMYGYTAHDNSGEVIVGTATGDNEAGYVWQDAAGYVHLANAAEYLNFYIDENGDLIMEKSNVQVDFSLVDGDMYVETI